MVSEQAPWQLLIQHGFIKSAYKSFYKYDPKKEKYVFQPTKQVQKPSPSHADQEVSEEANVWLTPTLLETGFPKPSKRYRSVYESFNSSLEEAYYWYLGHIRQDQAFPFVDKITDIFSASENSAFFGQSVQRLSIQEDRASSFMRGISELVKQLFQIIRELRIIDERLVPYEEWEKRDKNGKYIRSKSADNTLKGLFADFAENKGGQTAPGSLYHLAQTVGYATLPDLFFNTHIYRKEDVDKVIGNMTQFNPNVRGVLKRKLYQFVVWKEKTHEELTSRRRFQIRYLRQHWATIKMYMAWTKPYLKHIKRLHMSEKQLDSADIVSSFESSMTEVEVLFSKPGKVRPCMLITFEFKTRPMLQYRQEQHQGPVHVGRTTITLRSYAWTEEQIKMYKKMRQTEEQNLLYLVDDSVQAAMEELGDDLEKYINDAGKDVFDGDIHKKFGVEEEPSHKKKAKFRQPASESIWEPFIGIFKAAGELGGSFVPDISFKTGSKSSGPSSSAISKAHKEAKAHMWQSYKNYKKAHKLLSW